MSKIEETLLHRLEEEFAIEIAPDTLYSRRHARNADTIRLCLRTYVLLNRPRVPEETVARLLTLPFAEELLTRGRLDGGSRGSCKGLSTIFESFLSFISSDCSVLMLPHHQSPEIDLIGNGFWRPFYEQLVERASDIFKCGLPRLFHRNYSVTMQFLENLKTLFPSPSICMRHPSTQGLLTHWNVALYGQIQTKEIRSLFRGESETPNELLEERDLTDLSLAPSKALWKALCDCWSEDVWIDCLTLDLMRLSLEMMREYLALVHSEISLVEYVAHDLSLLSSRIRQVLVPTHLLGRLQRYLPNPLEWCDAFLSPVIGEMDHLQSVCWINSTEAVSEECKKALPALRTIKTQYQMTEKPSPTSHSPFVSHILRPSREFLERWSPHMSGEIIGEWTSRVVESVSTCYLEMSRELVRSAMELELSLKSRQQRSLREVGGGEGGVSDTEKMKRQFGLDVAQYEREVTELHGEATSSLAFQSLKREFNQHL
jgi:hypothetical protein